MGEISLPLARKVEVEPLYDEWCGWDLWGLEGGRKDWGERAGGWGVGREREDGWERGREVGGADWREVGGADWQ